MRPLSGFGSRANSVAAPSKSVASGEAQLKDRSCLGGSRGAGMGLDIVDVRAMPEPSERDSPWIHCVDPAIVPDAKSPGIFHTAQRLDIQAGPASRRGLSQWHEGLYKASLNVSGQPTELSLRARLEEDLRRHVPSQPESLPDLSPRDVWFLA